MAVLRRLKRGTIRVAHAALLDRLLGGSPWRKRRLLILAYHGISLRDEHEWNSELFIPQALLRERCMGLRDLGCAILPLGEAVRRLVEGTLPPRAVALTFDDGTYDFFARALPVLREFGFPATVYLTSYYAVRGGPVFDPTARYLLWHGRGGTIDGHGLTLTGAPLVIPPSGTMRRAVQPILEYAEARGLSADEKHGLLRTLAARVGQDFDALVSDRLLSLMRPDEVASLPRDLVEVGLHSHRHRASRVQREFLEDLEENRRAIRAMGGNLTRHYCYPGGDTDPAFLPWLRSAGVETATTCEPGLASRNSDLLMLPRLVDTAMVSSTEFKGWVLGLASILPRRSGRSDADLDESEDLR
jgi:peptidoglycan/xylan/chitin deacetylase (PgdA/CDA1 family)